MIYPVNYIGITQGFHVGKCLDFGWNDKYGGKNAPIYSCGDGVVYKVEVQPKGGNVIYIKHDNGMVSCYAHLSEVLVKRGDKVLARQQIGNMGETGEVSGPHLHFGLFTSEDVIYKDSTIDPFEELELYEDQIVSDSTEKEYGNKIKKYVEPQNPVTPEKPTEPDKSVESKEIKPGDTVIVNGVGTATSYGTGAKTKTFKNQKMKVIGITLNTKRPNRYALNQYNKGKVNDWAAVTAWFSEKNIKKA